MNKRSGGLVRLIRSLIRSGGYAAMVVATLAIGIGVSTAIFSILQGTLLRPLPYPEPDRLIRVRDHYEATGGSGAMTVPNFLDLRREARGLEELVAFNVGSVNLATEEDPVRAPSLTVTSNFFDGLGVRPVVGRGFAEGEDREGAARVAVISHRLWQERFAGSRDVLGRTLKVNARAHSIVGVLPASFWFPGRPQIVMPYEWTDRNLTANRGSRWLEAFARLADGVSEDAARAEMQTLFRRLEREYPDSNEGWSVETYSIRDWMLGVNRSSIWLLTGAVLLVLLIGYVNVANLTLVRAERRQREVAVRAALGAGRGRISWFFVSEGLALSLAACAAGLGVAWGSTRLLLGLFGGSLPRAEQIGLNSVVVAFAMGLALLIGLLVGLVPAVRIDIDRLQEALRAGAQGVIRGGSRLQRALVTAEIALAVVLVAGAGLLLNSFWHLNRVDTGIEPSGALTFRTELPAAAYESPEQSVAFYRAAVERIAAIPAVQHVGITDRVPLLGGYNITTLASPDDPELQAKFVEIRRVTPGFFPAAGIPLLQGRMLIEDDGMREAQVTVISDVLARTLFPDGDAVGRRIDPGWNADGYEVVGVVGSVREFGVTGDERPALYWPYPVPNGRRDFVFVVRIAHDDPMAMVPSLRRAIAELDRNVPLYEIMTLEDAVAQGIGNRRFATALFAAFGILALLLSALGIFGVLAFAVQQRTREMGIRVALGAQSGTVIRMIVGQGMRLVGLGLLLGFVAAVATSGLLSNLLFQVRPTDPLTLILVGFVALGTAAAACYLPARRAARVEPMIVLREE